MPQSRPQKKAKNNTWVRDVRDGEEVPARSTRPFHTWRRTVPYSGSTPDKPLDQVPTCLRSLRERSPYQTNSLTARPLPSLPTVRPNCHLYEDSFSDRAILPKNTTPVHRISNDVSRHAFEALQARPQLPPPPASLPRHSQLQSKISATRQNKHALERPTHDVCNISKMPYQFLQKQTGLPTSSKQVRASGPTPCSSAGPTMTQTRPTTPGGNAVRSKHRSKNWIRPTCAVDISTLPADNASEQRSQAHQKRRNLEASASVLARQNGRRSKVWLFEAAALAVPQAVSPSSYRPRQPSWACEPSKGQAPSLRHLLRSPLRSPSLNSKGKGKRWPSSAGQVQQQPATPLATSRSCFMRHKDDMLPTSSLEPVPPANRAPSAALLTYRQSSKMSRRKVHSWSRIKCPRSPSPDPSNARFSRISPKRKTERKQPAVEQSARVRPAKLARLGGHLYRVGGVGLSRSMQRQGAVASATSGVKIASAAAVSPSMLTPRRRGKVTMRAPWSFGTPRTRLKIFGFSSSKSRTKHKAFRSMEAPRPSRPSKGPPTGSIITKKRVQRQRLPPQIYCTAFCRTGSCPSRTTCRYVHDSTKVAVCPKWLQGTCPLDDPSCPLQHVRRPALMPVCAFFLQGACGKADCAYLHVNLGADAEVCQAFLRGYCAAGSSCRGQHLTPDMVRQQRKKRSLVTGIYAAAARHSDRPQVGLPRARRQNDCGRYFAPLSPHVATPSTSVSPFGRLQSQDLSWVDSPGKAFILDGESDPVALGDSASGDSSDDSSSVSTTSFDSCGSDPSDDSSSLSSDGTDSDESDWESEDEGLSQGSEDSLHVSQRSDMATV